MIDEADAPRQTAKPQASSAPGPARLNRQIVPDRPRLSDCPRLRCSDIPQTRIPFAFRQCTVQVCFQCFCLVLRRLWGLSAVVVFGESHQGLQEPTLYSNI